MSGEGSADAELDDGECHLISGAYAYLLQALLGFAALSALVLKRWKEVPKRDLKVWFFDASKQAVGGVMVHLLNIVLSILMSDLMERRNAAAGLGDGPSDACALYFMNFALDMAFGIFIVWGLLRLQEGLAQKYGVDSLAISGEYGMPPSFRVYRLQLGAYLAILAVAKTVVALLMVATGDTLEAVSDVIFYPVQGHPDLELTIVMVICPWLLNAFQFWLMDNMLMSGTRQPRRGGGSKYEDLQRSAGISMGEGTVRGDLDDDTPEAMGIAPREPSWVSTRRTPVARGRLTAGGGIGRGNLGNGGLTLDRSDSSYSLEMESYLRDRAVV